MLLLSLLDRRNSIVQSSVINVFQYLCILCCTHFYFYFYFCFKLLQLLLHIFLFLFFKKKKTPLHSTTFTHFFCFNHHHQFQIFVFLLFKNSFIKMNYISPTDLMDGDKTPENIIQGCCTRMLYIFFSYIYVFYVWFWDQFFCQCLKISSFAANEDQ